MRDFSIVCSICKRAPKIINSYIRMRCMCDEEVRILHLNDIKNPEHRWRFYLLSSKDIAYADAYDQRLD